MKEDKTKDKKDIVQGSDQWEVLSGKLNSENFLQLFIYFYHKDREKKEMVLRENIWFIVLIVYDSSGL